MQPMSIYREMCASPWIELVERNSLKEFSVGAGFSVVRGVILEPSIGLMTEQSWEQEILSENY